MGNVDSTPETDSTLNDVWQDKVDGKFIRSKLERYKPSLAKGSSFNPSDLVFISSAVGFLPEETLELLYRYDATFEFPLRLEGHIYVGITNVRIFKIEESKVHELALIDMKSVFHEHNGLMAWDKIKITKISDGKEVTFGICRGDTCVVMCHHLRTKLLPSKDKKENDERETKKDDSKNDKKILIGASIAKMYDIYVLVCDKDKIYVGRTGKTVEGRFEKHVNGKGAAWTKQHKPIKILEVRRGSKFMEDAVTLEYIEKYGIDNVRGGSYVCCILSQQQVDEINKKIDSSNFAIPSVDRVASLGKCPAIVKSGPRAGMVCGNEICRESGVKCIYHKRIK